MNPKPQDEKPQPAHPTWQERRQGWLEKLRAMHIYKEIAKLPGGPEFLAAYEVFTETFNEYGESDFEPPTLPHNWPQNSIARIVPLDLWRQDFETHQTDNMVFDSCTFSLEELFAYLLIREIARNTERAAEDYLDQTGQVFFYNMSAAKVVEIAKSQTEPFSMLQLFQRILRESKPKLPKTVANITRDYERLMKRYKIQLAEWRRQ